MNQAIAFITAALQLAPLLIQAGEDIAPFAEQIYNAVKGNDPTDADFAMLAAKEAALLAVINAPIPEGEA